MLSKSMERKFDRIKKSEEAGQNGKQTMNRSLRKLLKNKLAIVGIAIFAIIWPGREYVKQIYNREV